MGKTTLCPWRNECISLPFTIRRPYHMSFLTENRMTKLKNTKTRNDDFCETMWYFGVKTTIFPWQNECISLFPPPSIYNAPSIRDTWQNGMKKFSTAGGERSEAMIFKGGTALFPWQNAFIFPPLPSITRRPSDEVKHRRGIISEGADCIKYERGRCFHSSAYIPFQPSVFLDREGNGGSEQWERIWCQES